MKEENGQKITINHFLYMPQNYKKITGKPVIKPSPLFEWVSIPR